MTPLENDKICSIANSLDLVQKFDLKDRFSVYDKTKKFCRYCNSEYRLSTVYQYIDVHRYPLTTPGAALARLAQAPGRPREIIIYARSAGGIPDRGAKYGIVRSTIEQSYGM